MNCNNPVQSDEAIEAAKNRALEFVRKAAEELAKALVNPLIETLINQGLFLDKSTSIADKVESYLRELDLGQLDTSTGQQLISLSNGVSVLASIFGVASAWVSAVPAPQTTVAKAVLSTAAVGLLAAAAALAGVGNLILAKDAQNQCPPDDPKKNDFTDPPVSPLIVDLDGDGVQTTSLTFSRVYFDLDSDGLAERTAWASTADGFLALDRNSNGRIDDIRELFGSASIDGFTILGEFDENADGRIDANDSIFADLRIWRDANGDGSSEPAELTDLAGAGIAAINLTATEVSSSNNGNPVTHASTVELADGSSREVLDVWFHHSETATRTVLPEGFEYDPEALRLPHLEGYGLVPNLRFAMTQDAALLANVRQLVLNAADMTGAEFRQAVEAVVLQWLGVADLASNSRGFNIDPRHLTALEKWYDQNYVQYIGVNAGTNNPGPNSGYTQEATYQRFIDSYVTRFAAQVASSAVSLLDPTDFDGAVRIVSSPFMALALVGYDETEGTSGLAVASDHNLGAFIEQLLTLAPADESARLRYLDLAAAGMVGLRREVFQDRADLFESALRDQLATLTDGALLEFFMQQALGGRSAFGTDAADSLVAEAIPHKGQLGYSNDPLGRAEPVVDTIWSGASDDLMTGRNGGDSYVVLKGDGVDRIDDLGALDVVVEDSFQGTINFGGQDKLLLVGRNVADATYSRSGNDLVLTFADSATDQVRIIGQFNDNLRNQVERIIFADGEIGAEALRLQMIAGTPGDDVLVGYNTVDTLAGGTGNDVMKGGTAADLYLYAAGDGNDVIEDAGSSAGDLLRLTDIASADVTAVRSGADVLLSIGGAVPGSILLKNAFEASGASRIETIAFADGVTWSPTDLVIRTTGGLPASTTILGTASTQVLNGTAGNDVIDGLGGNDLINPGAGTDAIVFNLGSGQDTLTTTRTDRFSEANVVRTGIDPAHVLVTKSSNNLVLSLTRTVTGPDGNPVDQLTGDTLTIRNHFLADANAIDRLEFADGTMWEADTLRAKAIPATSELRLSGVTLAELEFDRIDAPTGSGTSVYIGATLVLSVAGVEIARAEKQFYEVVQTQFQGGFPVPLSYQQFGYDRIILDDGTVLSRQEIISRTPVYFSEGNDPDGSNGKFFVPTHYGETIYGLGGVDNFLGGDGDDTIIGGLGNDRLTGDSGGWYTSTTIIERQGSDTYVYASGDGNDRIIESGIGAVDVDRLLLTDLNFTDVVFERTRISDLSSDPLYDLLWVRDLSTGQGVSVERQFFNDLYGLEEIVFADGTTLDRQQMNALAVKAGTDGVDYLSGGSTFDGKKGDDQISGDGRPSTIDTALYRVGDGNDSLSGIDVLKLVDLNSADIRLTRPVSYLFSGDGQVVSVNGEDLVVTVGSTGETITLRTQFKPDWWDIELPNTLFVPSLREIRFANGEVWDRARIEASIEAPLSLGDAGDNEIFEDAGYDAVTGAPNQIEIDAGAGNDYVYAGSGNATIIGGAGDDILDGGDDADTFVATAGDGNDQITGDDPPITNPDPNNPIPDPVPGIDTYDASRIQTAVSIDLLAGTAAGSDIGSDTLYSIENAVGGAGDDTLRGNDEINVLQGGRGADALNGEGGDDILIGGRGADALDGGAGVDTASYLGAVAGISIDLEAGVGIRGDAAGDALTNIENVVATNYADDVSGDAGDNRIELGAGNDTADGRGGNDTILAGAGDDAIGGGAGNDALDAGAGRDAIDGDDGDDTLFGGTGTDVLRGGNGTDTYVWRRGDGNDTIREVDGDAGSVDRLHLADMLGTNVTLQQFRDDLLIGTTSGEELTVVGHFGATPGSGIEVIEFGDGYTMDRAAIATAVAVIENTTPIALDDLIAATRNRTKSIAFDELRRNDLDLDGDRISLVSVQDATHGSVVVDGTGDIEFTPEPNYVGDASFSYTVSDGFGGTSSAVVTLRVEATTANAAPVVAQPIGNQASVEDSPWSFTLAAGTFADADADPLALSAHLADGSDLPAWLHFDAATQTFSGQPPTDFNGQFSIVVIASDGTDITSDTFSLTIAPENDLPIVTGAATISTSEDEAAYGAVTATDADGDPLGFALKPGAEPTKGSVSFRADGAFTYMPNADAYGSDTFTVIVSDGNGGVAEQVVSVTIVPVNDSPIAVIDSVMTDEDIAVSINVIANDTDVDGDAVTLLSATALHGTVAIAGGIVTYTPAVDFHGSDTVTYEISDGSGGSAVGMLAVTVNAINDAPVIGALADLAGTEDTVFEAQLPAAAFSDVDGDPLVTSVRMASGDPLPAWLAYDPATLRLSGQPPADFNGALALEVVASDGTAEATRAVELVIQPVNDAPLAGADVVEVLEDDVAVIPVLRLLANDTDVDGDPLFVTAVSAGAGATATLDGQGNVVVTRDANTHGDIALSYTVTDRQAVSTGSLTLSVTPVNDAPVIAAIADVVATEDQDIDFTLPSNLASDVDGDVLTYTATRAGGTALPSWLAFDPATLRFSGRPPENFNGTLALAVTASDGPLSATSEFDLVIEAVNDRPTLVAPFSDRFVDEDLLFDVRLQQGLFSDADGDVLTYAIAMADGSVLPGWLTADSATLRLSGRPPADFNGSFDLRVTASDGALSVSDVFAFTVNPVNDAPVLETPLPDQTSGLFTGEPFAITIPASTFSDPDGDPLMFAATLANGDPLPAWLSFNGTTLGGVAPDSAVGDLGIRILASDGSLQNSDEFLLRFALGNEAPVANPDGPFTTRSPASVTIAANTLLANDTDADGDPLQITAVAQPGHGTIARAANGDITYTPATGFVGNDQFIYTISDGRRTAQSSVTVQVAQPYEDVQTGGSGSDALIATGGDDAYLAGGAGSDVLISGRGDDYLSGGNGADLLSSGGGNDILYGGTGDDLLLAGSGNDTISGDADDDTILAGSGDDRISGGGGADALFGGSGSDVFVFGAGDGSDVVYDYETPRSGRFFSIAGDRIELSFEGIDSFDALLGVAQEQDGGILFDFGGGDELFLRGTQLSALDRNTFTFT